MGHLSLGGPVGYPAHVARLGKQGSECLCPLWQQAGCGRATGSLCRTKKEMAGSAWNGCTYLIGPLQLVKIIDHPSIAVHRALQAQGCYSATRTACSCRQFWAKTSLLMLKAHMFYKYTLNNGGRHAGHQHQAMEYWSSSVCCVGCGYLWESLQMLSQDKRLSPRGSDSTIQAAEKDIK